MQKKTHSLSETKKIAKEIARNFPQKKKGENIFVGLVGELGSGKTSFLKGFCKAMGIKEAVISPTFVLMRKYRIPKINSFIIHIDAYRLASAKEFSAVLPEKTMQNGGNIIFIEWPECIPGLEKKLDFKIYFKHGKQENERIITIKKHG